MPVVYNGVPGTGEGDLFQGLKLWIAQRVPQRSRWVDLVKGNGGDVVKLEKNADMLIADNIKVAGVSPPLGSYMWRWIDDSVKNGFLQDKDDYLIGRREGSAREPGTSQPIKVGRTPFTSKDDLILTRWVVAEERMGNVLSGNVIYKALERKHPHHTWQSWRDRWVKTLRSRTRVTFSDEEIQAEIDRHRNQSPEPAPADASASRRFQIRQTAPLQPQPPNSQHGPATPPARAPIPATPTSSGHTGRKQRIPFTKEEDQLLLDFIEEVRRNNRESLREENQNLSGNVIYQDFATRHPTHSWHSWRDRWVRHLGLMEAVDDAGPDETSNADPDPHEARHPNKRRVQQLRVNDDAEQLAMEQIISPSPGTNPIQQQPNPRSDEARLQKKLRQRKEARAAVLIEKTWRGHAVRRDMARLEAAVVPLQSAMRGFVARMRTASLAEAHKANHESDEADLSQDDEQYEDAAEELQGAGLSPHGMPHEERDPREQFYDDLEVVLEVIGAEIDSEPTINGQKIDLWDLYRLARQQDCELEARDWELVTEGLGFEPVKGLVYKVQACYLQNLAEFEQHIKTFESKDVMNEGSTDEEEAEIDHEAAGESLQRTSDFATAPKQPVDGPSSAAYQSSPPVTRSKRSLEQTDLLRSDSGYPSSGPRKRRRVNRNSVIPPTPDEKLGFSNNSPHDPSTEDYSSPYKPRGLTHSDVVEISSGDVSDESMHEGTSSVEEQDELPVQSNTPKKRFVEPETQDWHLPQGPNPFDGEEDVSPSQQLLLESDAVQSPQQVVPSSRSAIAKEDHVSSPAAETFGGTRGPTTRLLRSDAGRAATPATLASNSRAPVNAKVKKRTLPASYQQKSDSTAIVTSAATASSGQPVLQSLAQSKDIPRPSSTTPARASGSNSTRPRQVNAYTPKPAVQSPAIRSLAFSPAAAPQLITSVEASGSQDPERWEEDHVEAQFRHFEALGYKTAHIYQAMEAGTMSRGPMIVALQSLHNGRGLPEDEPGVWTKQDCSSLLMVKKYERQVGKGKGIAGLADSKMKVMAWNLEKKHGKKGVMERWEFMRVSGKTEGI
ncbi:hypothetical protein N0V93_002338 [Gnomoniopsis smithogilvyi]|uniref:Telomeric repeat-binding factor 2-interacting protein 1 n=1 Tax=Gnomoniopsis smithogilvyi TaxID=1191159 RepID=A0A9W9CY28_9PEZI|nr:hypothetical protein N0V93_002338 [Gnomoniopsis smithogilvyi]